MLRVSDLPEPVPNRHFWPACQEHAQPDTRQERPHLSQQLHNEAGVVVAVALVERIDHYNVRLGLVQLRQRAADEMLPLIAQRLADNVAALCDSVADVLPRCWHAVRELNRNARHKLACVPHVAAAAREEEARCQSLPVAVPARHRPRDGRLARARQPAQPEDAPLICAVRPVVYLVEEGNARVGQAGRLVLLRERVEGRIFGARETIEGVVES